MESFNSFYTADKSIREENQTRTTTQNIFRFLLVIFILSWAAMMTSCIVAVPVSRHPPRHGVIIEQNGQGEHHDNGKHEGWKNR